MNELLISWLAALRSGKYKQGRYCLVRDDAFCCLGVLGTLLPDSKCVGDSLSIDGRQHFYTLSESFYDVGLKEKIDIDDFVELREHCKNVTEFESVTGLQNVLTILNDKARWSFGQIADWIETNYEKLKR